MWRLLALPVMVFACQAEIIDRIAVTVGQQAITELQLQEELRATAFFNQDDLSDNVRQLQAAANRLVEQLLVEREMRLSRYPGPREADIQEAFDRLRAVYPSPAAFEGALSRYGLSEKIVKEHLARQMATLKFVEYRFRPALGISQADLQNSYRNKVAAWNAGQPGVPIAGFDESRDSLRKELMTERTDEALDNWLAEMRKQVRVTYLDINLRPAETPTGA